MNALSLALPSTQNQAPTLRPYQQEMVRELYGHIRGGHKRILAIAVMGAGKTVFAASVMRDAVSRGRRVIFLIHLDCLARQTCNTLWRYGVPSTILAGGRVFDPEAPVIVASLQTIKSRLRRGVPLGEILGDRVGLVIADEAHVTAWDKGYEEIDAAYPHVPLMGLTATPWRLSRKEWLGQKFSATVVGPQPPQIIAMGGAVPCRWFAPGGVIDISQLTTSAGDYSLEGIAQQALRPEALAHTFQEWQRLAGDRPTMMVGSTVQQAVVTAEYFRNQGIPAAVVVGSTPKAEREAIFQQVKDGRTQVITSVGCLTAGFDLPAISCILMVRATKSKALFHQIAGRGSRPNPGKIDYVLLDFGSNHKHGNPMGHQDYSIAEPPKREPQDCTKVCPECESVIPVFAQICPVCGHEFAGEKETDVTDPVLDKLGEVFDREKRRQVKQLRKWRAQSFAEDLSPQWAFEKFKTMYGYYPAADWFLAACLGKRTPSRKRRNAYAAWIERHAKGQYRHHWIAYQMGLEFGTEIKHISEVLQWWDVLGVSERSSLSEVKAAYVALIKEHESGEVLGQLNEALEAAKEDITEGVGK